MEEILANIRDPQMTLPHTQSGLGAIVAHRQDSPLGDRRFGGQAEWVFCRCKFPRNGPLPPDRRPGVGPPDPTVESS